MGELADMPDSICADTIYLLSTQISIITAFYKASRQPWLTSFHRVVSTGWIIGIVLDCIVYSVYMEYTRLAPHLWAFVLQEWKLRVEQRRRGYKRHNNDQCAYRPEDGSCAQTLFSQLRGGEGRAVVVDILQILSRW